MLSEYDHPPVQGPAGTGARDGRRFLLDSLLEEQQQLLRTPVALFSETWQGQEPAGRFSHLIPLSRPQPDEQYAFEVNLDACTGCKACVAACHSLNGLDEHETWRDVGTVTGGGRQPYQQTVTTACHHCADPACASGCPVLAYEKDEETGIVRHLDDQCIGCSYCILKCPYDVPKWNPARGIVRKCDMCQDRLAEGEAPACVQACPNGAIRITAVKRAAIPDRGRIVAGAFESSYTRPSTRYVTARPPLEESVAADAQRLRLDPGHEPLAWMLVMTQMSAGAMLAVAMAFGAGMLSLPQAGLAGAVAWGIGVLGINLSVLHLGQPLKAWRAFLGWRRSWLSREIIAFGAYAGAGSAVLAAWWWGHALAMKIALSGAALAGLLAVFTSVMVYVDTRRPFWSLRLTAGKFFGTTLLLGTGLAGVVWAWQGAAAAAVAIPLALAWRWILSLWEMGGVWRAADDATVPWHHSARILTGLLRPQFQARRMCLAATGLILPLLMLAGAPVPSLFLLSLVLTFASQLIERRTFFTAAAGPRMPGS